MSGYILIPLRETDYFTVIDILIPLRETDYFTVIEVIWGWGPSYQ